MQKRFLFLVAMMLTLSLTIMAQITTSSMAGKVTLDDANGEDVIGATVVAVHDPSVDNSVGEVMNRADELMYADKAMKKKNAVH